MPDPTEAPPRRAVPEDGEYMTVDDFSRLTGEQHHAVWAAHRDGLVDAIPASHNQPRGVLRYHAEQVREILRGLEAGRG